MNQEEYTTNEAAKILGFSLSRIKQMLLNDQNPLRRQTHFPHAYKCKCGNGSWLIPKKDVNAKLKPKK